MGKAGCKVHKMDVFAMRGIRQDDSCSKRPAVQKDGGEGLLVSCCNQTGRGEQVKRCVEVMGSRCERVIGIQAWSDVCDIKVNVNFHQCKRLH